MTIRDGNVHIRAQWVVDSETGEDVLFDLDKNEIILRKVHGVIVPPEPKIRLSIRIVETMDGHRLDIKYPEKAHYENPERYVQALEIAARAIAAEAKIEMVRLQGGSMEVL